MYSLLALVPKNLLSRLVGKLVRLQAPKWMHQLVIRWFIRKYGIDVSEMKSPPESFRTLGDFFVRELQDGARPIGEGVVSPVDGTLRDVQHIDKGKLLQVKGLSYAISDLLGDRKLAGMFEGGTALNLYLSPKDYHRVHTPLDGHLERASYLPGTLWPVNDWAYEHVPALFAKNERLVVLFSTEQGNYALIFIGALNVGRITTSFDTWETNQSRQGEVREYSDLKLFKGQELGTFHLGSSVLLLFEPSFDIRCELTPQSSVIVGMPLSTIEK